jgi:3'-phosphoadenosine 5'-phosphosulfate sulfotransferase
MIDIDEDRLQTLMELVLKENPDMDKYLIWALCVNQLLNEQGIYGDEKVAEEIREKRNQEEQYSVRVV